VQKRKKKKKKLLFGVKKKRKKKPLFWFIIIEWWSYVGEVKFLKGRKKEKKRKEKIGCEIGWIVKEFEPKFQIELIYLKKRERNKVYI
jgi:hypothetical protein